MSPSSKDIGKYQEAISGHAIQNLKRVTFEETSFMGLHMAYTLERMDQLPPGCRHL